FRLRVRFAREVADEVREISWHPKQTMETASDGEAILELPARSIREARRFVLAYGQDAIALAPAELVADLKKEAEAMERLYRAPEKEGGRQPASEKIPRVRD